MNTIVCNTLTGAVSEYTRYAFQSITPTHGGSASGLFALEGDTDDGLPITTNLRLPATLRESTLKTFLEMVYLSMRGEGNAAFTVFGNQQGWSYQFALQSSGQSRCRTGKGIRENYVGFGLSTPEGQQFALDRIEVLTLKSANRRI